MSVRIVVDSTADVSANIAERLDVVPLTLHFGEDEFIDGVTITHKEFYEKLVNSKVAPSTSQATPRAFDEIFRNVVECGDSAVVITISSKLSGTHQSAVIAAQDYGDKVFVVDSDTVSIGAGVLAEFALSLVDAGKDAREIAGILEAEKGKVTLVALLDTLEYLKRGGRISKTAAFAGTLLSIKPVIAVKNGEIVPLGKARGIKNGNNLLAEEIRKSGGVNFDMPILLGYTGQSDEMLLRYISDSKSMWDGKGNVFEYTCIGSVVGTHAGPGTIGVAYFRNSSN